MDFSDISGITIIQVLFISFKTSSRIKCELEPPPPIITLSGCKRLDVILFCLKIFNASSSIINDALSANPFYLEWLKTQAWDGKLPLVVGEGGTPFIQIPVQP